jgi:hypothetical protein
MTAGDGTHRPPVMKPVALSLDDPVTVVQAPPDVRNWGPYQFPGLERQADGTIQLSFHVEADSSTAYGLPPVCAVSVDEGRAWVVLPRETSDQAGSSAWDTGARLPNGDRLRPATLRSRPVEELTLPPYPCAEYVSYGQKRAAYRLECAAGYVFMRQAQGSREWREERACVRLPGEVRIVDVPEGLMWFPWLSTQLVVAPDGALLAVNYTLRRIADGTFQDKCPVTLLRSTDAGRTWDLWSEIPYAGDPTADPRAAEREGFTEPYLQFLPDDSALCLLRTTDGNGVGPLYWMRSTDNGRTWTQPTIFDDLGVWPQMLTLGNGITLAVYGRPGLYVRATADPHGRQWDERVTVVEPGELHHDTCSYAALLPLADDMALIAYSEFCVPGPDGSLRKSIRVRRIRASCESER